jgi:hypothetical protein
MEPLRSKADVWALELLHKEKLHPAMFHAVRIALHVTATASTMWQRLQRRPGLALPSSRADSLAGDRALHSFPAQSYASSNALDFWQRSAPDLPAYRFGTAPEHRRGLLY